MKGYQGVLHGANLSFFLFGEHEEYYWDDDEGEEGCGDEAEDEGESEAGPEFVGVGEREDAGDGGD